MDWACTIDNTIMVWWTWKCKSHITKEKKDKKKKLVASENTYDKLTYAGLYYNYNWRSNNKKKQKKKKSKANAAWSSFG